MVKQFKRNLRAIILLLGMVLATLGVNNIKAQNVSQQQRTISGTVTDASGTPLTGVSVVVKGTTQGIITNVEGKYTIENVPGNAVLVFSFVGMATQEVPVEGRSTIDVALAEDVIGLDEVVVVGYGTQSKINVTGSVSTVSSEKLQDIPVANTSNTLAGKIPGLIAVNRGGEPGRDASEISIRGFSNMLVIVDGIEQPFDNLDPNEIESISVLKDASASIYGARAGNGVLLVTTRRGKIGAPKFTFNSYYGFQAPTRVPELADAAGFAEMLNAAEMAQGRVPVYSEEEIEKFRNGTDPNYPNTDWYHVVFKDWAPISQYNLNTTGGSEAVKYFVSLGHMDQQSLLKSGDTRFKRYNLRSNIDAKLSESFSVSVNLSGRIEQRDYPGGTIARITEYTHYARPTSHSEFPDPTKLAYIGYSGDNPVARADRDISGYTDDNRNYFIGGLDLKYDFKFLKGLSAKASFNYAFSDNYTKEWETEFDIWDYNWDTQEYSYLSTISKDQLDESYDRSISMTSQIFLNYDRTWGDHNLNAVLVGEFIDRKGNIFSAHREGYLTPAIDQLFAGGQLNKNNNGSAWQDGRIGYAGRLNYGYARKYLAEASFRYDASAKFIEDGRWGFFPSVSLGWRISEEAFMENVSFINNLKIRASYGTAGNDYVGNYNYLTGYRYRRDYLFGSSPVLLLGIESLGLANPDLTWENTATSNIGIDMSFAKEILGFEFDVFYRKVTDVPGYRNTSLPSTFGAELPEQNINSYDDRGIELLVRHKRTFGNFNYYIEGNVSWARSKWISYDEPVYADDETRERLQLSGQWRNRWFGYEAVGLFQSQEEINTWQVIQDGNDNVTLVPGDIKYSDYNGDGILNYLDEHVIGRGTTPEIMYGLTLGGGYKGIEFMMLWQGASNFNAYFSGEAQNPFQNGMVPFAYHIDYWSPENTDAEFPRMYPGGAANNKQMSTFWMQDATYVRLKNIQLSYSFPSSLISRLNIETLKLFVSGYNLITIDQVYPYDPETGEGPGWHYPQQKSFSIGINLTF